MRVLPSSLVLTEAQNDLSALTAMAGRLEITEDAVLFRPRFPFLAGVGYALVAGDAIAFIDPAPAVAGTARVIGIYPTARELPENNLKIYVEFSRPMSEGSASRSIRLLAADGVAIEGVLMATPELWDRGHRRLTVLLEPGRIKRGLAPNCEAGPPLVQGQEVVVVVDRGFADARDRPLGFEARRRYRIGPAVRKRLDPASWRHQPPAAGTREALTVRFDRPLDRGLLGDCLRVLRVDNRPVTGRQSVGRAERSWRFVPAVPWTAGRYTIEIDPLLEDLAGNSLKRVFDRDLSVEEHEPRSTGIARINIRLPPP